MSSFLERLKLLAAGRTFNAWFKHIGWAPGDITRINQGGLPGAEKLALLAQVENVNLTWLLTGEGMPYVVHSCATRAQAEGVIAQLDGRHHAWARYWFHLDEGGMVIVWARRGQNQPEPTHAYHELQVLVCIGPTALGELDPLRGEDVTNRISAIERSQIAAGWLGPYQLKALGLQSPSDVGTREGAKSYRAVPIDNEAFRLRSELLQEIDQLKPEDLQFVLDIVKRLLK